MCLQESVECFNLHSIIAVCNDGLKSIKLAAFLGVKSDSLREYMQIVSNKKLIPYLELYPSINYRR